MELLKEESSESQKYFDNKDSLIKQYKQKNRSLETQLSLTKQKKCTVRSQLETTQNDYHILQKQYDDKDMQKRTYTSQYNSPKQHLKQTQEELQNEKNLHQRAAVVTDTIAMLTKEKNELLKLCEGYRQDLEVMKKQQSLNDYNDNDEEGCSFLAETRSASYDSSENLVNTQTSQLKIFPKQCHKKEEEVTKLGRESKAKQLECFNFQQDFERISRQLASSKAEHEKSQIDTEKMQTEFKPKQEECYRLKQDVEGSKEFELKDVENEVMILNRQKDQMKESYKEKMGKMENDKALLKEKIQNLEEVIVNKPPRKGNSTTMEWLDKQREIEKNRWEAQISERERNHKKQIKNETKKSARN